MLPCCLVSPREAKQTQRVALTKFLPALSLRLTLRHCLHFLLVVFLFLLPLLLPLRLLLLLSRLQLPSGLEEGPLSRHEFVLALVEQTWEADGQAVDERQRIMKLQNVDICAESNYLSIYFS